MTYKYGLKLVRGGRCPLHIESVYRIRELFGFRSGLDAILKCSQNPSLFQLRFIAHDNSVCEQVNK